MYLSLREKGHLRRAAFLPALRALHLLCMLSGSALRALPMLCMLSPCFACFRHALPMLCVLCTGFACFRHALRAFGQFCVLCTCFAPALRAFGQFCMLCTCFAPALRALPFILQTNFILQTATLAGRLQRLGCQRQACWLHLPSPYHSQCTHPSPSRRKSAREPC